LAKLASRLTRIIQPQRLAVHIVAALVFGLSLLLYLITLAPGVVWQHYGQDGGELVSASLMLGVAHPPGYPTYLMIGHLFWRATFFDSPAFTFNLLSALSAAIAVVGFYYLTTILCHMLDKESRRSYLLLIVSAGSSLTFATSSVFWSQAVIAEVYTMNSAFFCLALLLAVMTVGARSSASSFDVFNMGGRNYVGATVSRWIFNYGTLLSGICIGVGMGNHLTIVFLAPPLLLYYFYAEGLRVRPLFAFIGGIFIGLMVYAYLPLRAGIIGLPINWGRTDTLEGFVWQITAVPYQDKVFGVASGEIGDRLWSWAWMTVDQMTLLGVVVSIVGLLAMARVWPGIAMTKINVALIYVIYSVSYATSDSYTYLIPVYGIMGVLLGLGWYTLGDQLVKRLADDPRRKITIWALVLSLALTLPIFNVATNYAATDVSENTEAFDYVQGVFNNIESNAVLVATGDNEVFAIWYGHYSEAMGPKVSVIVAPLLQYDWYWDTLAQQHPGRIPEVMPKTYDERILQIVKQNIGNRPVYFTYVDAAIESDFDVQEVDQVYRVSSR